MFKTGRVRLIAPKGYSNIAPYFYTKWPFVVFSSCERRFTFTVEMPTVFILYKHPLFARGLEQLLHQEGVEVVGSTAKAREALVQIRRLNPDVVIAETEKQKPGAEMLLSRLLKDQTQAGVVGVSLENNTATLYTGRRWQASTADDLVKGVLTGLVRP